MIKDIELKALAEYELKSDFSIIAMEKLFDEIHTVNKNIQNDAK